MDPGVETLKPAMCAACPPGRLQRHSSLWRSAADDTNYRPTDHVEFEQAGLSLPQSMWGVIVVSA
jgi:hypothetical protein